LDIQLSQLAERRLQVRDSQVFTYGIVNRIVSQSRPQLSTECTSCREGTFNLNWCRWNWHQIVVRLLQTTTPVAASRRQWWAISNRNSIQVSTSERSQNYADGLGFWLTLGLWSLTPHPG